MELAGKGGEEAAEGGDEAAQHGCEAGGVPFAHGDGHRREEQGERGGQTPQPACGRRKRPLTYADFTVQ